MSYNSEYVYKFY